MPITLNEVASAVTELQRKLGTGASLPAAGNILKGAGPGATGWAALTIADVQGLQDALDNLTPSVTWDSITGKPSTFTPALHSHALADITNLETSLTALANQLAIGATIGNSPAAGSMLFVGASGVLDQDANNLHYNSANGVVTIKRRLAIGKDAAYGTDPLNFYDSFGTFDQLFQISERITDCSRNYIMAQFSGIELDPATDPECYLAQGGQSGVVTRLGNTRNFGAMDLVGYEYYAQHNASSPINGMIGLTAFVGKGSATGTCVDMTGIRVYGLMGRGGGVTTGHGVWIQGVQNGGATYTNFYGLRISNQFRTGQTSNNCFALHTAGGRVWFSTGGAAIVGLTVQGAVSQSVPVQEWRDSGNAVMTAIRNNGGFMPATLSDGAAANNTLYFSSTQDKLCYKDSTGTVQTLH